MIAACGCLYDTLRTKKDSIKTSAPLFKSHRKRLLDALTDTEYYQENKKLFAKALDDSREGPDLTDLT